MEPSVSASASGKPSSSATQESHHDIQLDPAFVDRLKVAAATAIIKQKPASMSGKDYAKQLAERLREKEDSWKTKAKNLEMELLQTKQELLLARTKTAIPHNINDTEREAATHSYSDTSTDEPVFLTPPSSSEEYHHIDHQMALSRNTKFLHSVSTLHALGKTDSDEQMLERSSEVIVGSVKTAVDFIIGKSKGASSSHLLSSRMLREAADAIVKTLDTKLPPGCRDEIVALVDKLVESVLDDVMGNSKICNVYSQRESCCILLRLSKSSFLLPTILTAILENIEKVSTSLRNIGHHGNYLDVPLLENSFFLFSTMEDILVSVKTSSTEASSKESSKSGQVAPNSAMATSSQTDRTTSGNNVRQTASPIHFENDDSSNQNVRRNSGRGKTGNQTRKPKLDQGFRTNIQQRLEDSLLHISHDFPLYAQYVWRLTGILELMNE